jgi:RNA-dependent RNA polymerase
MHLVHADSSMPVGVHSAECIELAQLASVAVDFAKTGIPARFPVHLAVSEYPHYMERRDSPSYTSTSILAKVSTDTLTNVAL